jgi:hypothetical protein
MYEIKLTRHWPGALAIAALLFGAVTALRAEPALIPHTAEYKVRISVLGGRLTTSFQGTSDGFTAESHIEATGMSRILAHGEIRERSWFRQTDSGIRPSRYLSSDTLSKDGTDVDLNFDWDEQQVTGEIGGEDFRTDIDGILHDRVSLQYALMYDLMNGDYSDQYSLQDAEELKLLTVKSLGTKKIDVPFGKFEAIGLQHRAGNSSRVTTLWFARELGFLPVMIEQHRKGKLQVRAELKNYVPLEVAVTDAGAE